MQEIGGSIYIFHYANGILAQSVRQKLNALVYLTVFPFLWSHKTPSIIFASFAAFTFCSVWKKMWIFGCGRLRIAFNSWCNPSTEFVVLGPSVVPMLGMAFHPGLGHIVLKPHHMWAVILVVFQSLEQHIFHAVLGHRGKHNRSPNKEPKFIIIFKITTSP